MPGEVDPIRRCPDLDAWPTADRLAWTAATHNPDLLGEPAPLADLAPNTLRNYRRSYARWLTFLQTSGPLDEGASPAARITRESVKAYVLHLRELNASRTVAQRLLELCRVARVFAPAADWTWLARLARRLETAARPSRDKRSRVVPSDQLQLFGEQLMADAEKAVGGQHRRRAFLFRDGLMIALLAARPVRASNFAAIEIGRHLRTDGRGWWLLFEPAETKNRRGIELPVPDCLVADLERYLACWRPILLGKATTTRLWVSSTGHPVDDRGVYQAVRKRTEERLGVAMYTHLFRDCLATYIAVNDPEHVRIATSLLGHRSQRTVGRHYNQARDREADQRWQETLRRRRRAAARRRKP